MKVIKIRYSDVNNMGDQLNAMLLEKVFNVHFKHTPNYYDYDIMGIGSHLHEAFKIEHKRKLGALKDSLLCKIYGNEDCYIWGTGFIRKNTIPLKIRRKNIHFTAVRGLLSLNEIQNAGVDISETVTGDGGILASMLLDKIPEKKYKVGFIPHFKEQNEKIVLDFISSNPDMKIIDLKDDYYGAIRDIAECETIVSSSLHGIIVSDSFNIPWCYKKFTDKPLGDGFKFNDYFSNYSKTTNDVSLNKEGKICQNDIIDIYSINPEDIEKMKNNMTTSLNSIISKF